MKAHYRILDPSFVLRQPLAYVLVIFLAILPHYVVDYQTCYLVVKETNPEASLLGFIRHVLIEKFLLSVVLTILLFVTIFLLRRGIDRFGGQTYRNQLKRYLVLAIPSVLVGGALYSVLHVLILSFFPSHHGALKQEEYAQMMIFHGMHFALIFIGLVFINLIKSLIKRPIRTIEVQDGKGKRMIGVEEIDWVVKKDGIYELKAAERTFRTDRPIHYFERMLNAETHLRINRAAIVRQQLIKGYNYWEYDKYILRVGEEEREFVVSRNRMKTIKEKMKHTLR